ncbi:MAG: site-2 protease family protein [Candidatus Vogelbacteria bacterium]|nr:site-2 protease family protein [Candidatus Vogelbacteria bacterium]
MTIIIFLIILAVLIFTHELGHFLLAKWNGIKVEEFGFGFPPRLWGKKFGETLYSINWIPFGGFVKILGEEASEAERGIDDSRSLDKKPKYVQALVLAAGVLFNIALAWVILSVGLMFGLPTSRAGVPKGYSLSDSELLIVEVRPDSPAARSGLKSGVIISYATDGTNKITAPSITQLQEFIGSRAGVSVRVGYHGSNKEDKLREVDVTPEAGLGAGRAGIGIALDEVGILQLPFFTAIWEGLRLTGLVIWAIIYTLWHLLGGLFQGQTAALSSVTGPVGLVGVVGSSLALGISYLLNLTAIISLNLAVINFLPFPALDGGRILFLAIEAVRRKPISPKVANALNSAGFIILLGLMTLLTVRDVVHLFV